MGPTPVIADTLLPADVLNAAMAVCNNSQAELAARVGQTAGSTVSRWLNRKSTPDVGSALKLARLTALPTNAVLRAFGYDPIELGLSDPRPRRRALTPAYDLRILRISEMLAQMAIEVKSMANESQAHHDPLQDASASGSNDDYSHQTRRLWLVQIGHPDIPRVEGFSDAIPA